MERLEDKEKYYLENRLDDQINWYDKKSVWNQKWFRRLKKAEMIISVSIPLLVGVIDYQPSVKIFIGIMGASIAVIAGIQSMYKFHENWIQYRTTAETLKHEKYLYITKCKPYDGEGAFCRLVERVEGLISKENSQWIRYIKHTQHVKGDYNRENV
jgi:hypothetical protein